MKWLSRICLPIFILLIPGAVDVLGQGASSPMNGRTFVVLAEGAGGYTTLSNNLSSVYSMPALRYLHPIICRIPWSTDGENLSDYRESGRHQAGASRMAREVQRIRAFAPDSPIVLIGYSAGASVVLLAAEQLPACCLERIILLGPTVSARFDPRRALTACKLGIDSFNVPGDQFLEYLEDTFGAPYEPPGGKLVGTAGFLLANPRYGLANDPLLLKLRQYNASWLQNGHYGTATPSFLTSYVVPLIPGR